MKNSNTISFFIGVIFGAGSTLMFMFLTPATSQSTPTPTPTEEPEKW